MIIEVKQSKSNLANKFEVYYNKELTYYGEQSALTSMRQNVLMSLNGGDMLKTQLTPASISKKVGGFIIFFLLCGFMFALNVIIANTPLKVLAIGVVFFAYVFVDNRKRKMSVCRILDDNSNEMATFSRDRDGFLNDYYTIEANEKTLRLYTVSKSAYQYVPIYEGNYQIGQINKLLHVVDNKDNYVLYLLEEHKKLADLLSLFVIYFDSLEHGNRGEVSVGLKKTYKWTWDRNNKLYDPAWVSTYFGAEEIEIIDKDKQKTSEIDTQLKKVLSIIGICAVVVLAFFTVVFLFLVK